MSSQMLSFEDRFRDAAATAVSAVQDLNVLAALNKQCNEALTEAKAVIAGLLACDCCGDMDEQRQRARDWLAKVG